MRNLPKVLIINTDIEPDKEEIKNELAEIETRMQLLLASNFQQGWKLFEEHQDVKLVVIKVISKNFNKQTAIVLRIWRKHFGFKGRIIGIVNTYTQSQILLRDSRNMDAACSKDIAGCNDVSVDQDNTINTIRFAASQILTPTHL